VCKEDGSLFFHFQFDFPESGNARIQILNNFLRGFGTHDKSKLCSSTVCERSSNLSSKIA